jgi:hypothetical protein
VAALTATGIAGVVAAVVLAIGINRIVVTDRTAAAGHEQRPVTAFKSDYFRSRRNNRARRAAARMRDEDYAFARPSLTAQKLRELEPA